MVAFEKRETRFNYDSELFIDQWIVNPTATSCDDINETCRLFTARNRTKMVAIAASHLACSR
jgi:hypothetical protein